MSCVTVFFVGERRITVWELTRRDGEPRFDISEDGKPFDHLAPLPPEIVHGLCCELLRMGTEIGRLKRLEYEAARGLAP